MAFGNPDAKDFGPVSHDCTLFVGDGVRHAFTVRWACAELFHEHWKAGGLALPHDVLGPSEHRRPRAGATLTADDAPVERWQLQRRASVIAAFAVRVPRTVLACGLDEFVLAPHESGQVHRRQ